MNLFQVEMKSEALLKEHEVRRRDLLILKYDKQRSLCDEIILRQQKLIEGKINSNFTCFSIKCFNQRWTKIKHFPPRVRSAFEWLSFSFLYPHCFCRLFALNSLIFDRKTFFLTPGSSVPMPPELMELYGLYQQELASRNEKEANYLSELNVMLRVSLTL